MSNSTVGQLAKQPRQAINQVQQQHNMVINLNQTIVNQSRSSRSRERQLNNNNDEATASTRTSSVNIVHDYSEEESSESSSFCRHCLRPQSELQLYFLRHRNRSQRKQHNHQCTSTAATSRKRSKQRNTSAATVDDATRKHRSKSRKQAAQQTTQTSHDVGTHMLPTIAAQLNAANEEAIRFRCPQVGPLLGHNVHAAPMHFHHPLHQQQHHYAYQQYQQQQSHPTTIITIDSVDILPPMPPTLAKVQHIRPNLTSTTSQLPNNDSVLVDSVAGTKVEIEVEVEEIPDSPSLVKVRSWYTVAKQGVPC